MRILVAPNDFPQALDPQPGIFVLRQIQALQRLGHEVRVLRVVPWAPPFRVKWRLYRQTPSSYEYEGVKVRTIRAVIPPRLGGINYWHYQTDARFRRQIAEFGADVVHAHFLIPAGTFAVGHGCPVVATAHGGDAYDWPWRRSDLLRAAKRVVRNATRLAAVSRFVGRYVEEMGGSRVTVVYNGADEATFAPFDRLAARASLGIEPDRCVVAFAGAVVRSKGVFELAHALGALAEIRPLLLVAGSGKDLAAMRHVLAQGGVEYRSFGTLAQSEVSHIFAAADVVALPSHVEGLPTVICEAMLAGRAVVASAVGGIPEIVHDGETGYLVPPRAEAELARALKAVLIDTRRRDDFGCAAHAFAQTHLTWNANALAYERIYREATASRVVLHDR